MCHVLIRSRITYRDDYDLDKPIPYSVYMDTSRPQLKYTLGKIANATLSKFRYFLT